MKKILKRIDLMLVFIITLLTCSGCFSSSESIEDRPSGPVSLISMPATTTVRVMSESLYIGYLGAQRDFALIIDNGGYNLNRNVQNCANSDIGCSSIMIKLLMNYGIKTSNYTGESSSNNLLLYYTTSDDFNSYGGRGNWYSYLASDNSSGLDNSDFAESDDINYFSCGTSNKKHDSVCSYSKEMSEKGYSNYAGNSMILLFDNGSLYDVITDKSLDKSGKLNQVNNENFDDLKITNTNAQQKVFEEYYLNIINKLRSRINVSNATHSSLVGDSKRSINSLDDIQALKNLVSSSSSPDDYLLLVTSSGFIDSKIGTNYYASGNKEDFTSGEGETNKDLQALMLMFNTVTTFTDNCALESEPLLNFLKNLISDMIAGTIGELAGAGIGAGLGALIGSVVPGVGTAAGAAVGAIVGAIVGFFAGIKINNEIEEKMKSANGISDISYCRIMQTALNGISLNVPIYHYNIDSAKNNIQAYNEGKLEDSLLKEYYDSNMNKCKNQYTEVGVPSGIMSFFTDAFNDKYAYADTCEKELVSQLTGGVVGSPSLHLVLNGKKVDDLHGRVTTELLNEMMIIWGLQSIGDLYTVATTSNRDKMSVTLGGAQEIKDIKYCISESAIPSCDGLSTTAISTNSTYIGATTKDTGITLDFTDIYKGFSKAKLGSEVAGKVAGMSLNISRDENSLYYRKNIDGDNSWTSIFVRYTGNQDEDSDQTRLNNIESAAKQAILAGEYQIKYGNYYYVICNDGTIVGYTGNKIVYYSGSIDGESIKYEYIFNNSSDTVDESTYYTHEKFSDATTVIRGGHSFYVYIQYTIAATNEQAYYSYVI